jgi:hypothetical protein
MSLEFAGVEEDDARSPRLLQDRRGKKVTEEQSSKNMMTRIVFSELACRELASGNGVEVVFSI